MFKVNKIVLIILSIALCMRLFFSTLPPFKTDMDSWIGWGEQMYRVGPGNFYKSGIWTDYTPGYLYILWIVSTVQHSLFEHASREVIEFLFKIPPIVFDLGCGYVIYLILRKMGKAVNANMKLPALFMAIYLFSPFTFFNSSIWGQADSVATFFALLSAFMLIQKKFTFSTIALTTAFIIKPQNLIIAPIYLIFYLYLKDWRILFKQAVAAIITFFVVTYPFWEFNGFYYILLLLSSSTAVYPYNSLNAYNLWGIYGFWIPDNKIFFGEFTMQETGTFLFVSSVVLLLIVMAWLLRKKTEVVRQKYIFIFISIIIFSFNMLMTRMHERYLFPMFGFMLVFAGLTYLAIQNDKKMFKIFLFLISIYLIVSLIHFVDLYYVYTTYLHFTGGVPESNRVYYFISAQNSNLSLAMTILYVLYILLVLFNKRLRTDNV